MGLLVNPEDAPGKRDRLGFVAIRELPRARASDDALHRGPGGDDIADPADEMQHRELR